MPARTGYERVLAHRTDDLFAKVADNDGSVESISDSVLKVAYKDGSTQNIQIGRRFGKMGGDIVPHSVVTDLKVGSKFKKGDILVYNKDYFSKDKLDPSQVIYKPGVLAYVALMESTDTFEDSSAVSTEFAKKLVTNATHIRTITVPAEQVIRNMLKVGSSVEVESILCTIQNPTEGNKDLFDEAALQTLQVISANTPRAKATGIIEKIEVLYTGELEDMSESLRDMAEQSDRSLVRHYKQLGKPAVTGQVEVGFRVDGIPLDMDMVAIRVYITGPVPLGVGDKVVFSNQLKSIAARVMTGTNETDNGIPIDAKFGYQSIADRIVLSPELMGTLNSLLVEVGKRAVAAYRKK